MRRKRDKKKPPPSGARAAISKDRKKALLLRTRKPRPISYLQWYRRKSAPFPLSTAFLMITLVTYFTNGWTTKKIQSIAESERLNPLIYYVMLAQCFSCLLITGRSFYYEYTQSREMTKVKGDIERLTKLISEHIKVLNRTNENTRNIREKRYNELKRNKQRKASINGNKIRSLKTARMSKNIPNLAQQSKNIKKEREMKSREFHQSKRSKYRAANQKFLTSKSARVFNNVRTSKSSKISTADKKTITNITAKVSQAPKKSETFNPSRKKNNSEYSDNQTGNNRKDNIKKISTRKIAQQYISRNRKLPRVETLSDEQFRRSRLGSNLTFPLSRRKQTTSTKIIKKIKSAVEAKELTCALIGHRAFDPSGQSNDYDFLLFPKYIDFKQHPIKILQDLSELLLRKGFIWQSSEQEGHSMYTHSQLKMTFVDTQIDLTWTDHPSDFLKAQPLNYYRVFRLVTRWGTAADMIYSKDEFSVDYEAIAKKCKNNYDLNKKIKSEVYKLPKLTHIDLCEKNQTQSLEKYFNTTPRNIFHVLKAITIISSKSKKTSSWLSYVQIEPDLEKKVLTEFCRRTLLTDKQLLQQITKLVTIYTLAKKLKFTPEKTNNHLATCLRKSCLTEDPFHDLNLLATTLCKFGIHSLDLLQYLQNSELLKRLNITFDRQAYSIREPKLNRHTGP